MAGSVTVATGITMTPGGISRIDLTHASINAAKINDQGGFIYTDFNCNLTSPDIVFGAGGSLQAANGTTTLTSLPQLSNGTLTGATIHTDGATVVVPGDIPVTKTGPFPLAVQTPDSFHDQVDLLVSP